MKRIPDTLPVFPLPGITLFPRMGLPLHIFELRYRSMLADVLDSHGLIAMACAEPRGQVGDEQSWQIAPVVGLGRVELYEKNEDGTSDIVLVGQARARIAGWLEGKPYRTARLNLLSDTKPRAQVVRDRLKAELERHLLTILARAGRPAERDAFTRAFAREREVGFLVDLLAHRFLEDPRDRQVVLEELDVEKRQEHLRDLLGLRGLI